MLIPWILFLFSFWFNSASFSQIIDLIKLLIKNVNQKEWKAYKFTTLVEMLQKVDRGTLDDIWVKCLKDEQLRWVLA